MYPRQLPATAMTRLAFTLCLLTLGLSVVSGPTAAQNNGDILPFPVTLVQLDNGLTLVGVTYDSPGIVAYYTIVRTGSRNEVEQGFLATRTSSST